jgi:hypothetical protein
MAAVRIIQLIRTELTTRGFGVDGDPIRRIAQYWSMDGVLLFEHDPVVDGSNMKLQIEADKI